ncbi:hypothetical protein MMC25_004908 [Agyrium rufum]|nr:hypothetical protein [Agyrium rufum]
MSTNDTTPLVVVGYVSDPNGRGTISLLLSCVLTLILCVWSALHLDIPPRGESHVRKIVRNGRWILVGVFAPELVVFTTWRQWSSAKLLGTVVKAEESTKDVIDVRSADTLERTSSQNLTESASEQAFTKPFTTIKRMYPWTRTHDFFASTGGFAFEVDPNAFLTSGVVDHLPTYRDMKRLTLTARGVAFLAKCDHLPDIPEEDIQDKSKANDLAKALVVVQASWMLIQTLGRLIVRLPVTLLEVNTIAHVCCVFLLYLLWWDKPLLPEQPIILRGPWVESIAAYMYISSELSGEIKMVGHTRGLKSMLAKFNLYSRRPEINFLRFCPSQTENEQVHDDAELCSLKAASKTCLPHSKRVELAEAADTAVVERRPKCRSKTFAEDKINDITLKRWALASEALQTCDFIMKDHVSFSHDDGQCRHLKAEEFLVNNVQNWPLNDLLRDVGSLGVGMMLWAASFVYGAIHAAAWNDHFPTVTEKWLWKASAVYIGFCGGLWIILNYLAQKLGSVNRFWDRWMEGQTRWCHYIIFGVPVVVCGSSFLFARVFIVVEAFINLRELPMTAYDTPNWEQVFPHF